MTRPACGVAAALLLLGLAAHVQAQQHYLYTPKAVNTEESAPQQGEGVLVREVPVHRGDTLAKISKRFSGRASYYPQILLFNRIDNPDLIYAGDTLRVPVSPGRPSEPKREAVQPAPEAAGPTVPAVGKTRPSKKTKHKHRQAHRKAGTAPQPKAATAEAAGAKLYERAMTAYRQDDCRAALELFDRFLAGNPSSPLAADASLYKAECYLKQSR
ncbi:tetratricopeptide repeat protein [Geobacter sp. SVR]|uniref:LysM peptidoglycan-binding domain-containing protein n=1 Tax=Geobacter sp. SVR TaxID=2495594 RepID=UPI00143EF5ED|nr:tetratricopeptide repeat protein [Geobacter sp. SVR]BCS52339.1 peptidoglycan-binding protein LysM [Geobacter sp. SVR]GCF85002.1 peptidoglycan-binding protein LysM [Geobacter sp. SVR]